ncbi:MAG TPA: delta-60 repeat domain-containing protein, partial [Pyrinomonadaceae bacterium]|nr:delta-60 repeat domain-containing protein [Pyrinomonadaceae bacterium]
MFRYFVKNNRKFRSTTRFFLAAMLPIMQIISAGNAVQAQQSSGSLDPTFNGSGKVVTDLGNPDNIAGAVAVQPDGKIVVVGLTGAIESKSAMPGSSDFVVLRYNPDGTLDNTFDGDGKVVTSFGNGEEGASEVLIQPDGKILVAGSINTRTPAGEIALARYNPDGSLDATFDGDGKVTTDAQQNIDERASAMVLQPDGKIVVAVSTVRENSLEEQIYVVRFNADGSHDFSFAGDGITTLPCVIPGGVFQGLSASDVALQTDGKIVVAGTVSTAQDSDFFVWRLNPDGTGDQT